MYRIEQNDHCDFTVMEKKEWHILLKGIRWNKQFQSDTKKTPPTKKKFRFPFAAGLLGGTKSKTDENRCELGAYQDCLVYFFFFFNKTVAIW